MLKLLILVPFKKGKFLYKEIYNKTPCEYKMVDLDVHMFFNIKESNVHLKGLR